MPLTEMSTIPFIAWRARPLRALKAQTAAQWRFHTHTAMMSTSFYPNVTIRPIANFEVFAARSRCASAVLGIVILSFSLSVCPPPFEKRRLRPISTYYV